MALSVKVCPSVICLALRAIGSSTTMNSISYAFRQHQSPLSFSSVAEASKDLVDATLSKVLKCEIKSAKSNLKISQVETPTDSFPFTIKDGYRWRQLSLERKFPDGEYVCVEIEVDKIEYSNEERDGSKKDIKPDIPMSVRIRHKNNGRHQLFFEIIVSNENIIVKKLHIWDDADACIDGPAFREMDSELKRYIIKYLEIRGITSNITSFLLERKLISQKEKEVDFMSLKHLKKVIEN